MGIAIDGSGVSIGGSGVSIGGSGFGKGSAGFVAGGTGLMRGGTGLIRGGTALLFIFRLGLVSPPAALLRGRSAERKDIYLERCDVMTSIPHCYIT